LVSEFETWLKVIVPGVNVLAWKQAENSEVLPAESVAVAVMKSPMVSEPGLSAQRPSPLPFVVVVVEPISVCPSPLPAGSQVGLAYK
jgi:hypothetical protein